MDKPTSAYTHADYESNYPDGAERFYWNVARVKTIASILKPLKADSPRILDVGCGRGIVLSFLRQHGYDCWGCDTGPARPISPAMQPYLLPNTDFHDLNQEFREAVHVVLLLDVVEHINDRVAFLKDCISYFPNLSHLLVTVPARMELWSQFDEHYGHFLRFDLRTMRELLRDTGLHSYKAGYFFHTLYALMLLSKILGIKRSIQVVPPGKGTALVHRLFGMAMAADRKVIPGFASGSSMYALVKIERTAQ